MIPDIPKIEYQEPKPDVLQEHLLNCMLKARRVLQSLGWMNMTKDIGEVGQIILVGTNKGQDSLETSRLICEYLGIPTRRYQFGVNWHLTK